MPYRRHIVGVLGFALVLISAGCQLLPIGEPSTPTIAAARSPTVRATATLILPTPPPGATLTAMVETYRLRRTPTALRPTETATPSGTQKPTSTTSPTAISGPSVYVVPEVAEPGGLVDVRGAGWAPDETVTIGLGSTVEDANLSQAEGHVRGNGTFGATLGVPEDLRVENVVIVAQSRDGQRRAVTRLYLLNPTATLSPTPTASATEPPTPTVPPTATATPGVQGWRGEYYDNRDLRGAPVHVRDDRYIDFDWDRGVPAAGVPADDFSVRWTREVDFRAGMYQFDVQVDDGIRVYIDDQLVLDQWRITSTTSYEFRQALSGPSEVRVEYFDTGGNATVRLEWRYLGRYPDWRGAYYDNQSLLGTPVIIRNDTEVNFNWGDGSPSPQIPADGFSVRWSRVASFAMGTYRFHAQADDGVRVWVDNQLIIDEWHISSGDTHFTADMQLFRGDHDVRIDYFEAGGKAEVVVWWENLDAYPDWRGAYFDNRSLSGPPALVRNDSQIDFNWGERGPDGIGPDDFSVQWTSRRDFFERGVIRFHAKHDDGVRVWLDDRLVIDEWYETGPVTHLGDSPLAQGMHEIRVDYFEASGTASIRVWWEIKPIQ